MTGTESRNIDSHPEDEKVLYFYTVVDGIKYHLYPDAMCTASTAVCMSCLEKIRGNENRSTPSPLDINIYMTTAICKHTS
jgi:hypothetical protein